MIRSVGLAVAVPVILSVGLVGQTWRWFPVFQASLSSLIVPVIRSVGMAGSYLEMVSSNVVFPECTLDTFCWFGRIILGDGSKHRRLSWMYL